MSINLPVSHVFQRDDARKIDQTALRGLVESIREVGIINPLRVRPAQRHVEGILADAYEVTAGHHRLSAAMKLGLETVPCVVVDDDDLHAELIMIDENLCRAELDPAQRAKQTARRKAIYVELHPETAQHVAGGHAKHGSASANLAFAENTAVATGKSERAVQRDAERGEKIAEDVLDKITGTDLATGVYLDYLKKTAPEKQAAKVEDDLRTIAAKAQHRTSYTGNPEWYTPAKYLDLARQVLGGFDLDPASHEVAQRNVRADKFFTAEQSGLEQEWNGRIWLNPPYSHPLLGKFIDKLLGGYEAGRISAAILLTNNFSDTLWFHKAARAANALCFTKGRIRFEDPVGKPLESPVQGQSFFYFGPDVARFHEVFGSIGLLMEARP
ncbi:chromosome partitioning protein, ParB family [Rhizobiales bacterium GAS113]|nr:chromosome partitioning protein, ParB family [Rhizobiales bacterium GAS113]